MENVVPSDIKAEEPDHSDAALAREALVPGVINGAINGVIAWFTFRAHSQIPITGDSISSDDLAVFGKALQIALTLCFIGTIIAYFTFKTAKKKPPFFPNVAVLTIKNIFLGFGVGTSVAIVWHRMFGTISISPLSATLMTAAIAILASWYVTWATMREIVKNAG